MSSFSAGDRVIIIAAHWDNETGTVVETDRVAGEGYHYDILVKLDKLLPDTPFHAHELQKI